MKSEKGIATNDASNTDLKNKLTMNNLPNFQFKSNADGDRSRRELLEQTKLSRLPKFELSTKAADCVGCGGRLETDNDFQQSIKVCRKCLAHYAKIENAIDEASKRKRRELIEKFAEVK